VVDQEVTLFQKLIEKMNPITRLKLFHQSKQLLVGNTIRYTSTAHRASQISNLEDTNEPYFRNVKLITPQNLSYFMYNHLKLKFIEESVESRQAGVELLRNIAANYDYWIVRNQQDMLLYYRLQMMQQRLDFLKPVGLDYRQKLRHIQKSPPVLIFSFSGTSYESKMVYLRGVSPQSEKEFLHLFYPITKKTSVNKADIQTRVSTIEEELKIKQPSVIRELLNMPCFFMDPVCLNDINHKFIHKYSMPYNFDTDKHTLDVLPPILDLPKTGLSVATHFSNKANNKVIAKLPTYQLKGILDYSYPNHNGKGQPECLSTFLVEAELEEDKDRTGGQPLKGRRGFNVPPRQY